MKFIPIKCECGGEFKPQFYTRWAGVIWPPVDSVFVGKGEQVDNRTFIECNKCGKIITNENIAEFMKEYFENE